jgi:homoserine O-acetyltransferase
MDPTGIDERYDPPDSPRSVGWVRGQRLDLGPWRLELGGELARLEIEYECYGALNAEGSNVILVAHALTGDAHAAGWDAEASEQHRSYRLRKPGWWDTVIGPGKALDTERFCVICISNPGSCHGSTGPTSIDPASGRPYGLRFPLVTIGDWVRVQAAVLDRLGISRLYAVLGGSLGGQQSMEWALAYPERVERAIIMAAAPTLSAQGLGFNAVGRHAIINDSRFNGGDYYGSEAPEAGLAAARMLGHITYLSDAGMHERFGRKPQRPDGVPGELGFGVHFQIESYLDHQGRSFVDRYDANAYLYMTRAMDFYDAAGKWGEGDLQRACARIRSQVMVVSFSSDWLYPPRDSKAFAEAIIANRRCATYVEVPSQYGHDAFLVEHGPVERLLRAVLAEGRP